MKFKIKHKHADNNVNRLYDLESEELPRGASFSTLENVQGYVDFVTSSHFWKAEVMCYPSPESVKVHDWGENPHSEARDPNQIWLARHDWNQQAILHELAHFIATTQHQHGPKFVRAYLSLIAHFMGLELSSRYRRAFGRGEIKF